MFDFQKRLHASRNMSALEGRIADRRDYRRALIERQRVSLSAGRRRWIALQIAKVESDISDLRRKAVA